MSVEHAAMPTKMMTAQWVERVKPPAEGREEWFDEKETGLGLRVSASGKKAWFVMYRVKGDPKKRRLTLDPFPQMGLADARERAKEVVLDAARGLDPAGKKQELKQAPTFAELAQEYLDRWAKQEKRSWREDQRIIERELLPRWGGRKAHDIKRKDVFQLLDDIKGRGAPIQANRTLALVRVIYNWALERDIVEMNPCAKIKAVASENQRDRVLTETELRAVWRAFDGLNETVQAHQRQEMLISRMFKLRLLTAQRGGEVAAMRWAELDLANGWWTIPQEFSKNKLSHRVPLSPPAVAILQELRSITGDGPWVFPGRTNRDQPIGSIQKAAQRVQQLSGVDFVMHDLRRTAASYMTGMGISRLVVSKILNHVEQGITRVYDRYSYDGEKRQALEAWGDRLLAIVADQAAQSAVISV